MSDQPPTFPAPSARRPGPMDDADDDLLPSSAGRNGSTPLAEITAELTAELEHEETFEVPGRPGYAVRYDIAIDHDRLGHWRKRAADKTQPDGLDELKWAASILAAQAVAIVRQGADLELDGQPATFISQAFRDLLGVGRPTDAVKALYGRDAHVVAAAWAVLAAAGYGDQPATADDATDPTSAS